MLIFRLFSIASILGASLLSVGCGFARVNMQRDYISPEVLSPLSTRLDEDGNWAHTERVYSEGKRYRIQVDPLFKTDIAKTAMRIAYEKNLEGVERDKANKDLMAKYDGKTCVSVQVIGLDKGAADFSRLYLKLRTTPPETVSLSPLEVKEPEVASEGIFYEQGGTTYRSNQYTNRTHYCADKNIDLTRGFTVFIDRRHEFNLPVVDLVWATDKDLRDQFASWPGIPASDPFGRREWIRNRYTENTRTIRNQPHFAMPEE